MITVVIPVLNESPTVESVVKFALRGPGVTEVLVVDDGSIDGTPALAAQAGARVVTSTLLGKGASMEDGAWAARNEILLYLDGDLSHLADDLIERMTTPLLTGRADFVKARFSRSAGRVTMLTARPLLLTFFPELTHIEQPLGGIIAVRRGLLRNIRFETDYGVDVGLLLDVAALGTNIEQVDVGHIEHDSQSLDVLGDMAMQVVRVILERAARYGRLDMQQLREVEEVERHSQAELARVFNSVGHPQRLALFDMDGTLLKGRFIVHLAQRTNRSAALEELLDSSNLQPCERTRKIAALFAGVTRGVFEETARSMPLMPGAVELIIGLRQRGFRVGIVSDSYRVATEIVRRRVFADFSIAHLARFRNGVASGDITLSPAMQHESGCPKHTICKRNVLLHMCEQMNVDPDCVLAVGDGEPDACMLEAAGHSIAFQPKSPVVSAAAQHVLHDDLREVLTRIDPSSKL